MTTNAGEPASPPPARINRGDLFWLVLCTQSYEGVSFEVVWVGGGKMTVADAGYLYQCAF